MIYKSVNLKENIIFHCECFTWTSWESSTKISSWDDPGLKTLSKLNSCLTNFGLETTLVVLLVKGSEKNKINFEYYMFR